VDPLSHMLITVALIGREPETLLASVGPDLPWYVLYPVWLLSRRGVRAALQNADWPLPPQWMQETHYAAHSLLLLALGLGARRWLNPRGNQNKIIYAWLGHVLLDIPTHARRRMGTRIFWPLSSWSFDGLSWADYVAHLIARLWRRT
jgi:hypothetical protein